ncbi:MAG: hypothetical protein HOH33_16060 [Verrucomicrobia bacterium]|jgi:solute:Na+ symporter, SSS family|nr:hypothetical protein [Verrucomicrobiota bacterium]
MQYLGIPDWCVIVFYLLGIVVLGVVLGKGQKGARDYFLGGRNIPWWGVGLSILATETSALTFIGVPALAYGGSNLTFIQIVIGYVLARVVLTIWVAPSYFRGEIYSPYALIDQTFGAGGRLTAGAFFLIAGTLAAGVRVYVTCIPIQLMLGLSEGGIIWAILLFVGLSLIYTYVGGLKSVVWTDAIQFGLFVIGGMFVVFYLPGLYGGGGELLQDSLDAGKWEWFHGEFSWSMPFNIWMGVFGAIFLTMSTHGADQLIVQRVLACRDLREGRKALMLSAVLILPMMFLFLVIGILLWTFYQKFPDMKITVPEVRPGVRKADYIFPIFILTELPAGIKGFLVVGVISAAMSSVSSALSALASVSTMDFYKRWGKAKGDDASQLKFSRVSTLVWAGLLVGVAWWTKSQPTVLNVAFSLSGLTAGGLLGGLILSLVLRGEQRPGWPLMVGMIGSLLVVFCVKTYAGDLIAWPWFTLIGLMTTLVLCVACMLASGQSLRRAAVRD